jgi:histidinol-phosphatase (PHP family)
MTLPADSHVHSEWSWDTGGPASNAAGRMALHCERAVRIGLPALIFTEHLDFGGWPTGHEEQMPHLRSLINADGVIEPPPLQVDGYFEAIERMRSRFPDLTILTGVEFGQPHLFEAEARALVDLDRFDRINGSLHTFDLGGRRTEPNTHFLREDADAVMWAYLEELPRMVAGSDVFEVFTHIDYAVRNWPTEQLGPFDPTRFEDGFRSGMRAIAESGRALEMNTRRLWSWIPQWWSEEGGRAISFGSDAHTPDSLANHFPEAMLLVDHYGFRAGSRSWDFWVR